MQSTSPYQSSPTFSPTVVPHSPVSPIFNTTGTNAVANNTMMMESDQPPRVAYICHFCGKENHLLTTEFIRCESCLHRIMYKKRTNRSKCDLFFIKVLKMEYKFPFYCYIEVQYEAR